VYLIKGKNLPHKNIFVYGAYLTIIILVGVITIIDILRGSTDAYFDFFYVLFTYLSFRYLCKKSNNVELAGVVLFWISAIFEFFFIFSNKADFDLIFTILVPIIAFISMKSKRLIVNIALYYVALIAILSYFYLNHPNHFILHNLKFLLSYVYAHIFIIAYGFFYYFSISESVSKLENLNKQNTLLLKEVHHRVKNNLNIISSILGLKEINIEDKDAKEALHSSRKRIESMAILHEILYKKSNQNSLSLKEYLDKLITQIINSESSKERINFKLSINDVKMSISNLIQFGIMINELVTNSIKYANSPKEITTINITFQKLNRGYKLIYCDNAVDIDLDKLKSGFGYKLIELSIAHFEGNFMVDTNGGLCYFISLKEI